MRRILMSPKTDDLNFLGEGLGERDLKRGFDRVKNDE